MSFSISLTILRFCSTIRSSNDDVKVATIFLSGAHSINFESYWRWNWKPKLLFTSIFFCKLAKDKHNLSWKIIVNSCSPRTRFRWDFVGTQILVEITEFQSNKPQIEPTHNIIRRLYKIITIFMKFMEINYIGVWMVTPDLENFLSMLSIGPLSMHAAPLCKIINHLSIRNIISGLETTVNLKRESHHPIGINSTGQ